MRRFERAREIEVETLKAMRLTQEEERAFEKDARSILRNMLLAYREANEPRA